MAKQRIAPNPNVGRNIAALMERKPELGSQPLLAKRTGIAQSTVGRILRGESNATSHNLKAIAEAFGIEVDLLYADPQGFLTIIEMKKPGDRPSRGDVMTQMGAVAVRPAREVPIVGTTQGGPPDRIWLETGHPVGHGDQYVEVATSDPHAYGLRVVGDSMAPRIMEGEWIVVEPSVEPHPGDEVVVRTVDGEVMVKVFVARNGDTIILDSINQAFKRITKNVAELDFMHYVGPRLPARAVKKRIEVQGYSGGDRRWHDEPFDMERRASATRIDSEGAGESQQHDARRGVLKR